MDEGQKRRGGRRRRPPGLTKSSADQISSTFETETIVQSQAPTDTAPTNPPDGTTAQTQPPERRRRARKPKKQPLDALPSAGDAQPAEQGPSRAEPLTWQQESILNVSAADFRPSNTHRGQPLPPPPPGEWLPQDASLPALAAAASAPPKKKKRPKKPAAPQENAPAAAEEEAPHCLLCCNTMSLVSFGACGHKAACGPCCLRMRMCYGRTDCPLCKTDLPEVIISPYRKDIPDFSFFQTNPEAAARSRPGELGPGCVLADRWQPGRRQPSSRLLHDLARSTAVACSVCDPQGRNPFTRPSQLEMHLRDRHNRFVCGMCLREGRNFPLEAVLYDSEEGVRAHGAAAHPHCDFCRGRAFFDGDALWAHMMDRHHRCTLCEPGPGGGDPWFADVDALRAHLSDDHFACDDADCVSCLVAFRTADELRRHHMERHSARMPRWNPATARPMQLDIQFVRRPGAAGGAAGAGESNRRGQGRSARRRGGAGAGGQQDRPTEFAHEIDGGYRIIDDDLGMLLESTSGQQQGGGGASGALRRLGGGSSNDFGGSSYGAMNRVHQQHRQGDHAQDAFPSLAASTAEAVADRPLPGGAAAGPSGGSRRPPPLIKHTIRCPCGRRVTYPVIEEGQEVPILECDAVCRLEGRRRELADAFGVEDPHHHVSVFDRRPAVWSGALLEAAKRDPAWVHSVEKELGSFVADREVKRRVLTPMPRAERALVHAMAQQYGLASVATGAEPRRCIELFKAGDTAALPSRLLSKVAVTVTDAEIAELLHAAEGHPVRFVEIAPTANLGYYLRRWEGRYEIEWQGGSQAIATFEREEDQKEALDSFGGGIRGLFRIDRTWHPKTGVSTGEGHGGARGSGAAAAAPWAAGGGSSQEQNRDGSSGGGERGAQWRSVASGQLSNARNGGGSIQEEERSPAVPSGWAVIGGKKAVKPRLLTAERPGQGVATSAAQFSALRVEDDHENGEN